MPSAALAKLPRASARSIDPDLLLHIPADATTLAGFRAWVGSDDFPEKIRTTFISGEVYLDMSQEELETHNKVKTVICSTVYFLNEKTKRGTVYTDGVLLTNEEPDVSNNPDGMFILRESIAKGRVRLVPRRREAGQYVEIEGTPDWVLEVVSVNSVRKDTQELRVAYQKARIPEYWLIDARGEEIDFQILIWHKDGYRSQTDKKGWQRSKVFGHSFRLVRRKDDLGLWEYTLEVASRVTMVDSYLILLPSLLIMSAAVPVQVHPRFPSLEYAHAYCASLRAPWLLLWSRWCWRHPASPSLYPPTWRMCPARPPASSTFAPPSYTAASRWPTSAA